MCIRKTKNKQNETDTIKYKNIKIKDLQQKRRRRTNYANYINNKIKVWDFWDLESVGTFSIINRYFEYRIRILCM